MSTHPGEAQRGRQWLGIGGVPPGEQDVAYRWERRLHWVMIGIALLSIPAFYLEEFAEGRRSFRLLGSFIEIVILAAFTTELVWMLRLTRQKWRYLARNWLDVLVVLFSLASVAGIETEWVAMVRLDRKSVV